MRAVTAIWQKAGDWFLHAQNLEQASAVICFGPRALLETGTAQRELAALAARGAVIGCSTGGQFAGQGLLEDAIVAMIFIFERTRVEAIALNRDHFGSDSAVGSAIGQALTAPDLAGVFLLSDGLGINGSALVKGLQSGLGCEVPVTGGLAGDGADFGRTYVFGPKAAGSSVVAAVGFYGKALRVGHGSYGGWRIFGPRRLVTRSEGNVLFELDGKPALDLYERYLSPEEAAQLPASALLFPLMIADPAAPDHEVVRTVLGIDRAAGSMTFAGDIPQGWTARLMHGASDNLNNGAGLAGKAAHDMLPGAPEAAILVSCIGRRLLLGQNVGEELRSAIGALGEQTPAIGFYSYGEIAPQATSMRCDIHNQTMTITTFREEA